MAAIGPKEGPHLVLTGLSFVSLENTNGPGMCVQASRGLPAVAPERMVCRAWHSTVMDEEYILTVRIRTCRVRHQTVVVALIVSSDSKMYIYIYSLSTGRKGKAMPNISCVQYSINTKLYTKIYRQDKATDAAL